MTALEVLKEFGIPIIIFVAALVGCCYFISFIRKHGLKGLIFIGNAVEEIGTIPGGDERPNDKITIYKLTNHNSNKISWCLNMVTKSKKFHGAGRVPGEMPLALQQDEMAALLEAFTKK